MTTFAKLTERLHKLGINSTNPGFYDDRAFVTAEREDPHLLEAYASYVELQNYSSEYIEKARRIITSAVDYLSGALHQERLMGACIGSSLTLARFLERKGVWCYIVKGALAIRFSSGLDIEEQIIAPIMLNTNPACAGHVWVVAPPFKIIDITVKLQPYSGLQGDFLPEQVLAQNPQKLETLNSTDLFDSEAYGKFVKQHSRKPSTKDVEESFPGILGRIEQFGIHEVQTEFASLRYVACGITAPDGLFELATDLVLHGKRPFELFLEWDQKK